VHVRLDLGRVCGVSVCRREERGRADHEYAELAGREHGVTSIALGG
jgi:hypothetical protein